MQGILQKMPAVTLGVLRNRGKSMATEVVMPKWGMTMKEGVILRWLKEEGEVVSKGDPIAEVESEKAVNFVESSTSGVLKQVLVKEGATVPVSTRIAWIAAPDEELPDSSEISDTRTDQAAEKSVSSTQGTDGESSGEMKTKRKRNLSKRVAASPAAKRLSRKLNLSLEEITPTGPGGMIVVEDVERARNQSQKMTVSAVSQVSFYSSGMKLSGILYLPDGAVNHAEILPGLVFCQGYTYVKELLVTDMARHVAAHGYAALVFDYRGFGSSEGEQSRLRPLEQVEDIQAAMTFLGNQPSIDAEQMGLVGISLGGSHAVYTAAIDARVRAAVAISPMGDGKRWLSGMRRYDEWNSLLAQLEQAAHKRVLLNEDTFVDAWDIVRPDPESQVFLNELFEAYPHLKTKLSLETARALINYSPEKVIDLVSPQTMLLIHGEADQLVPAEESRTLLRMAHGVQEFIGVRNMNHFNWARPTDERFCDIMRSITNWLATKFNVGTDINVGKSPTE